MSRVNSFKTCPSRSKSWFSRDEMLYDPDVSLLGYQVHFVDFNLGLFYFNHNSSNCKTTFAIYMTLEYVFIYIELGPD